MKKLTKATALILSAVMLFGCTSNSANGSVGDTTPPGESSGTESESKNDSSVTESSVTDSSSTPDNSNDKSDENLVKNIEGYQTFSYDSSVYEITNENKFMHYELSIYDHPNFEPDYNGFRKATDIAPIGVKCHVIGDSYYVVKNKCGDKNMPELTLGRISYIYTPVVIDEIVETFGQESEYKTGDIVYVLEEYEIGQSYNGNEPLLRLKNKIKFSEQEADKLKSDGNDVEDNEKYIKQLKEFADYLSQNSNSVINAYTTVLLERGQSFLVFLDNKGKNNFEQDGNKFVYAYAQVFDLENESPKVYTNKTDDNSYFYYNYRYVKQWNILKEKYGEHFKK